MPTTTTTTTTPLNKSYLWLGTSDYTIEEIQYTTASATNVYTETLTSPVDHILLAENNNKMYVSTPDKLYVYAVDYCQTENQIGKLVTVDNSSISLIDNYYNSYAWAVQAYNNKVVKTNPTDLSVVKEYTGFDAPFKIVESKYHKAYFVAGTHILWKIDQLTDIITAVYSVNDYNLVDFDISEGGVICLLLGGLTDNIARILKNDLYSLLFNEIIDGNLRYCKYCKEGKFYFLSELNNEESYSYSAANYLYDSNSGILTKNDFYDSILVTTTTTTLGTTSDAVQIEYPNGGEQLQIGEDHDIKWLSSKSETDFVKIELCKENAFYSTIIDKTENTGIYGWTIPTEIIESNDYKIKITWLSSGSTGNSSTSAGDFYILNTVPTTTTTTTTLVSQKAIGVDYDEDTGRVIVMLGSGLFMLFDLSGVVSYGLVESTVTNVVSMAARTAKISPFGVQDKVRVFVGSAMYQNDKWDSGEVSTNLKSMYYGGGNNLKSGEIYWVHIQTHSEQAGWGELQVKSFVTPK